MSINKNLQISGTMITSKQLEEHLEKSALEHSLVSKSKKSTYPIPFLIEDFKQIQETYNLLNDNLKKGITIHPAGEWILDNLYVIEETVKMIEKELPLKKYINFPAISKGQYSGFARIYVVASEIVAYTDNKIERENLENYLISYQSKKTLSMDEVWSIGIFLQIAIIKNIAKLCKSIYDIQMQKYRAENIAQRIVEGKNKGEIIFKNVKTKTAIRGVKTPNIKYPFIEYMSYILKRYGKQGSRYLRVLEETVEMAGTTVSDVIKKEHFDIAVKKVLMGNGITSIKEIQRMNFLNIFEKINGVEELLKQDPANVYAYMDYKTKEYYRTKIKEVANKTKMSEIYITKKILQIANEKELGTKKSHIGYYLIDNGIYELLKKVGYKNKIKNEEKVNLYIIFTFIFSTLVSLAISSFVNFNCGIFLISSIVFYIPSIEFAVQIIQWFLGKTVKPKLIPKMSIENGIEEKDTTMVIIPTIIDSEEKVSQLIKKLEVYYLANKSKNIYFTLLGDCTQSEYKEEAVDKKIIDVGIQDIKELNEKYKDEFDTFPIFNFVYRKRTWNEKQNKFLGWERKRGMITQFNEYLLGNSDNIFRANTIEEVKEKLPKIKYVITLDADTDLILNSAFELIGAMSHILNKPVVKNNIVVDGYGIIQPRIGVNLDISYKNLFTKIFAGAGGIDLYTNAISDVYQDCFKEGIFAGKGIYDLQIFSEVLRNAIPENTVLSHDLLEGSYLRCGLATDIVLMDGYPSKYTSFMNRLSRWIRGDWQISSWLDKTNCINTLSKYKILDNLRRSLFEISIIIAFVYLYLINSIYRQSVVGAIVGLVIIVIIPFIIEIFNNLIGRKENERIQKTFTPKITGIKGAILRAIITFACLPYKAYISLKAIIKTMYRMRVTHKNLLEWTTSEEAEKSSKTDLFSYIKIMIINILLGIISIWIAAQRMCISNYIFGALWIIAPVIMWYISREKNQIQPAQTISKEDAEYVIKIGKSTWSFFEKYLNSKNNYLIPDNYQEGRNPVIVPRTSSTNIGLSLLAVISAYDLKFIKLDDAINLLEKMMDTINELPKWKGHLYNWYEIETKQPLLPRYISTVDSGNFVGYLYVLKSFIIDIIKNKNNQNQTCEKILQIVNQLIKNTDFSALYDNEHQIFSIGFNIEENKLTDSYYDLLASEARQASIVAIAKKDVSEKHWKNLSRTLTTLGNYKGLLSWSGTAFEYLMPNINIPKYEGSLLDESCKFLIMSQMKYANKLAIPWGISESAFNLKDLHGNYQYKAFGIPWLGLKRGLADEMVVSSYGSILAISEVPKDVIRNIRRLESNGMYSKFGLYEAIDLTPERVESGKNFSVVKTYMAHHQALILLSINNFLNNKILSKRFLENPEIESVTILLQERMPEKSIITKESKEKIEKPIYKGYENYIKRTFEKIDYRITNGNVISNENYSVAMDTYGRGVSKYKDIYINRFKPTQDYDQAINMCIKNIKAKTIWNCIYCPEKNEQYKITFTPDGNEIEKINGNIRTKVSNIVAPKDNVEIRTINLENLGNEEEILEVTAYFEPVLSNKFQDYAHPAFNNLFLEFGFDEENRSIVVKRRNRENLQNNIYLEATLNCSENSIGEMEYEFDKEKFLGRCNFGIPQMVRNSSIFSKRIDLTTDPIVALKRTIKIKPEENVTVDLILSVGEEKKNVSDSMKNYLAKENVKEAFKLSKAKVEEENRYLRVTGKDIEWYQKLMSYIVFGNPTRKINIEKLPKEEYKQSELWKYGISGDFPIILVKIKDVNDSYVVSEVLKMYEYLRSKNIQIEIVILDEEKHSYENYVKEEIEYNILNCNMAYLKNIRGGIFNISKNEVSKKDIQLFEFVATLIVDSTKGGLKNNIKEIEEKYLEQYRDIANEIREPVFIEENNEDINILKQYSNLKYYNEYGGFSEDGTKYLICINNENKLPTVWAHIMANEKFGTIVTENMGGYTWYKNSRLNRISTWENDPVLDLPSEVIFVKDEQTKKCWSLGQNPMPDNKNYNVIYGCGYCKYIHKCNGIEQELEMFVPQQDSVKIGILNLKNSTPNKKKLKIYQYINLTMGEDEIKTRKNIYSKYDQNNNMIYSKNLYNLELEKENVVYVSNSEKINSYTSNKQFFIGKGTISNPEGLKKTSLNDEANLGYGGIIAYEISVEIECFSEKEVVFIFGSEESLIECKNVAYKYRKIQNCKNELNAVKKYWENLFSNLQIRTPLESINILLNGWIPYQTLQSRLIGRSGYYQSGGAYGFRDQLQDCLGIKYLDSNLLKNQILKCANHQFIEGDVLHWWHQESKKGIRTRITDDLLWMVYGVEEYIEFTNDEKILDLYVPYLNGKVLSENEEERYDVYNESDIIEDVYHHCIKAIEKSLNFGKNGLPKIGTGDWNDGLNKIGNKGNGESVWLGFFLYDILNRFIPICTNKGDEDLAKKYEQVNIELKKVLNTVAWDGRWYKRAFTDDEKTLGSMENEECKIDRNFSKLVCNFRCR